VNAPPRWTGEGLTDRGLVRASNQDAFYIANDRRLWIVADGMGGHPAGDVASRLAVEHLSALTLPAPETDPASWLDAALRDANRAVYEAARRRASWLGMGTTVVVMMMVEGRSEAIIGYVGDSRAYHYQRGCLHQLTRDHTLADEAVRAGLLSEADARRHPHRHILSRALGTEPVTRPDVFRCRLEPKDAILLCTDGLTKMLDDAKILELLERPGHRTQHCAALIDEANRQGGEDNTTVLMISAD
jgi:PPM family protein phosphatase